MSVTSTSPYERVCHLFFFGRCINAVLKRLSLWHCMLRDRKDMCPSSFSYGKFYFTYPCLAREQSSSCNLGACAEDVHKTMSTFLEVSMTGSK